VGPHNKSESEKREWTLSLFCLVRILNRKLKAQGMEGKLRFTIFDRNIISDVFGDEAVLVNLETGVYFSLRASAAQIWIRLQNNYSVDEIIADLLNVYLVNHDELLQQTNAFVQQLIDKQLIKLSDIGEKQNIAIHQNEQKLAFSAPILEVFSDMQEILLLDPVHDVDKAGWPVSKDSNENTTK